MSAIKIVESIMNDSPLAVTNVFADYMKEMTQDRLAKKRNEIAASLFTESMESDLDGALDYVFDMLEQKGIDVLEESVTDAAREYNVPMDKLINVLSEEFEPEEKPLNEEFITALVEMVDNNAEEIVMFENNTARLILPEEAKTILELWVNLNRENRRLLEQQILKGAQEVDKILEFAEGSMSWSKISKEPMSGSTRAKALWKDSNHAARSKFSNASFLDKKAGNLVTTQPSMKAGPKGPLPEGILDEKES